MALRMKKALDLASIARIGAFDEEQVEQVSIELPEDFSTLNDTELEALRQQAIAAFNDLYAGGERQLSSDEVTTLRALKDAKLALDAEKGKRAEAAAASAAEVAEFAAAFADEGDGKGDEGDDDGAEAEAEAETDEVEDAPEEQVAEEEEKEEALVASAHPRRIAFTMARSAPAPKPSRPESPIKAAMGLDSYAAGSAMDLAGVADAFAELTESARPGPINAAKRGGQRFSQKHKIAHIERTFDPRAVIDRDTNADEVLAFVSNESNLPGGSLVASGGWCAPSETAYGLYADESRDGILSVPEVNLRRGGLRYTLGPDWADIFADTGWCFTEADDEAGNYDGASSGTSPKPTDIVPCPTFTDVRLDVCGVTIQSGILLNKAYPEAVQRYVSGALIAHDHRVATNVLVDMIAGSTAVTHALLTNQTGVTSPVLSAIELQVEDIKYRRRLSRGQSIEAIFPYWARGAIRADLALREGKALFDVTDAQILSWFKLRGINPQFIYNFDNLGAGTAATAWPTSLRFLIYPAGTWVKGTSDLITISMLHDSTLNENNNFTAIFTEEGWNAMRMKHDSRIVTVAICPDGNTAAGADISCA